MGFRWFQQTTILSMSWGWPESSKSAGADCFGHGGHSAGQPGDYLLIQASVRGSPGTSTSADGIFPRKLRLDKHSGLAEIVESSGDTECRHHSAAFQCDPASGCGAGGS